MKGLEISRRRGPSGDSQMMLAPADARTALESARQIVLTVPGAGGGVGGHKLGSVFNAFAPAPAPNSEPASTKAAALMPSSCGMKGIGKRTSAVADQKVLPPSASLVRRSRGPKPPRSKPRMVSPPL